MDKFAGRKLVEGVRFSQCDDPDDPTFSFVALRVVGDRKPELKLSGIDAIHALNAWVENYVIGRSCAASPNELLDNEESPEPLSPEFLARLMRTVDQVREEHISDKLLDRLFPRNNNTVEHPVAAAERKRCVSWCKHIAKAWRDTARRENDSDGDATSRALGAEHCAGILERVDPLPVKEER